MAFRSGPQSTAQLHALLRLEEDRGGCGSSVMTSAAAVRSEEGAEAPERVPSAAAMSANEL